jgi:hypothetical protein
VSGKQQQRPQEQPKTKMAIQTPPKVESDNANAAASNLEQRSFVLALEEYKIIQVKMDKIGDFCHKVKGWSLTITAGALAGTATTKVPWWFAFAALITTWLFKMGDDYQSSLRSVLAARAMDIERYFHDMDKDRPRNKRPFLPFLANAITDKWKEQRRSKLAIFPGGFSWKDFRNLFRHNREFWAWRSDPIFYYGQLTFIICATLVIGKFDRPEPSELEAKATSTLSALTNSAFWRGEVLTNITVFSNSPSILNTIIITNQTGTNIINVSVPVFVTNTGILTNSPSKDLTHTNH